MSLDIRMISLFFLPTIFGCANYEDIGSSSNALKGLGSLIYIESVEYFDAGEMANERINGVTVFLPTRIFEPSITVDRKEYLPNGLGPSGRTCTRKDESTLAHKVIGALGRARINTREPDGTFAFDCFQILKVNYRNGSSEIIFFDPVCATKGEKFFIESEEKNQLREVMNSLAGTACMYPAPMPSEVAM